MLELAIFPFGMAHRAKNYSDRKQHTTLYQRTE